MCNSRNLEKPVNRDPADIFRLHRILLLLITIVLLSACGPNYDAILKQQLETAKSQLDSRETDLSNGSMLNAEILKSYVSRIREIRPDMLAAINILGKEATTTGRLYSDLIERYNNIKSSSKDAEKLIPEVDSLIKASSYDFFNDSLVDPLNVLADLSEKKLPRISVMSKEREADYNAAKSYGTGEQLVGNPTYGSWQGSGGTSFWEWYGMYAMFSNLMGGGRIGYNDWNRNRPYSNYQDRIVDRYNYGHKRDKQSTYRKSAKYKSTSGRKSSSFSRGGGVAKASPRTASRASGSRMSSSNYSGNLRRSSSYSGGFRGGK